MLSAVVLAKNEEGSITRCLKSLSWCDEIIVIDDYSTDRTVTLARKHGATVFTHALKNDFAAQRNYGLSKTKGEWVLFVDADEVVSKDLAGEITVMIKETKHRGFLVMREGIVDEWILRLARHGCGRWSRIVHETWGIKGSVAKLRSPLTHSPTLNISKATDKLNFYSSLHAKANTSESKNASLIKIIFMPLFKFLYYFFVKGGYKKNTRGFVFSCLMGFHSYLSWSKQWELQKGK